MEKINLLTLISKYSGENARNLKVSSTHELMIHSGGSVNLEALPIR